MNGKLAGCALGLLILAPSAAHAGQASNDGEEVGLLDLALRIGADNLPDGTGVVAGHVEFADAEGDYSPNLGLNQFVGKTFTPHSGATGISQHANNVAFNYYGNTLSIAPGITDIHQWEASSWLQTGFLRSNSGADPLALPGGVKVFNHSWIAEFPFSSQNNNALRRADWVILRDDVIMCVGVDNDESGDPDDDINAALMNHLFNGLTVGVDDGSHMNDPTLASLDGPGRMQPIIVAPGAKVSWATPVVAAAAALLVETARTVPLTEGIDPAAERSEVIKAALLAGTQHRPGWTNNPAESGPDRGVTAQPVDDVFGADLLNVDASHWILTRGRQPAESSPPASVTAGHAGWDLATVGPGTSAYWRLAVCGTAAELSAVATWHRQVESPFGNGDWALADFDLRLWRIDAAGQLVTLVGDPGLAYFGGGNVVSQSRVDNLEHLYVTDLEPGQYVLELERLDNETGYPDYDAALAWRLTATAPAGDANDDCIVGVDDFLQVLGTWGPCPDPCPVIPCPADFDGDCDVDINDFLTVIGNWGS